MRPLDYPTLRKNDTTKTIKNITKSILAIQADSAATPLNPKMPAIMATTKNSMLQLNNIFLLLNLISLLILLLF